MQLFYCKDMTDSGFATLDADESRHAVRVLRLREGDDIHVTDGRGWHYRCRIVGADDRACGVECVEATMCESVSAGPVDVARMRPRIHLAVAPTKNPSRMEWLVEKAVEMGVGEITLLHCDHSERSFLKTDRLEKIAVSAMKQSLHTVLPAIHPAVSLRDWLHSSVDASSTQKYIAHCEADKPRTPLADVLLPSADAVVLIGPEGDFSADEIALTLQSSFVPVSLGTSRLRTETAALYAVAAFNFVNDRS